MDSIFKQKDLHKGETCDDIVNAGAYSAGDPANQKAPELRYGILLMLCAQTYKLQIFITSIATIHMRFGSNVWNNWIKVK